MQQPKQKKPKEKKIKKIHTSCGQKWDDHHIMIVKGKPVWLCP